jgi:ribonuclease P protein component
MPEQSATGKNHSARHTFPKAARLTRANEFEAVRASGKSIHGKLLVLGVLEHASTGLPRIGIITSRRVGGAVSRSRVRRLIREAVRPTRHQLAEGIWLVVVAKHSASRATAAAVQREWTQLCDRARLWKRSAPKSAAANDAAPSAD